MLEEPTRRSSRQNYGLRAEAQELFHDVTANKPRTSRDCYVAIAEKRPSIGMEVCRRARTLIRDTGSQDLAPPNQPSSSAGPILQSSPWASNRAFHGPWSHRQSGCPLPL